MGMQPALMSILTASLLLPVMYRRHRRLVAPPSLAAPPSLIATPAVRRGRFAVMGLSAFLLFGAVGGGAWASNDRDGSKTSISSESVLPAATAPGDVSKVLSAAIAKDRTSIKTTWLMVGGVLVLFMQAGSDLRE